MADELKPFATVEDLTNYWKAPDNATRAEFLLKLASSRLRLIAIESGVDIDARAATDPYKTVLQSVVLESVKRALQTPDGPSVESWQQTAGPYSENIKYVNPTGDIFFRKAELASIGLNGSQRLDSISTSITDIYGS